MPAVATKEDTPYAEYTAEYLRGDATFMAGVRRGLADVEGGRVSPWDEIKQELGIEEDTSN